MDTITLNLSIKTAILVRDALRFYTDDQELRMNNIPTVNGHCREIHEVNKYFSKIRRDIANEIDVLIDLRARS